jgi:class 3 adenylate cyclase
MATGPTQGRRVRAVVITKNLAILFTDIKGFTERTSRQTLEQNQKLLATHDGLLAPLFRAFGGKVVKSIGDAFLVTFESPTNAVLAGVAIQDRLWAHNRSVPADEQLHVRVAINVGEVRVEAGDVFGEPVNIAARVEGVAEAGEVSFTEAVHLSMNKAEVPAEEVGDFELKGIPGKIKVYRVPKAPYRVAPAGAEGPAPAPAAVAPGAEQPPFGNLGLAKITDDKLKGPLVDAAALQAFAKDAVKGGGALMQRVPKTALLAGGGLLAVVLLVVALVSGHTSDIDKAIEAAQAAPPEERYAKVEAARALIDKEKDLGRRQFHHGQLAEALDDASAATAYKSAARAGFHKAERQLIDLLKHPKCAMRSAAADAIADLRLTRAKGKLEALEESGGPDDGEQVLIFGCNSRKAAQAALKRLEAVSD